MQLLTVEEVAALLKISIRQVNALCRQGKIAYVSISRKERRFTLEMVQAYVESRTVSRRQPKLDRSRSVRVTSPKHTHSGGGGASSKTEDYRAIIKEMSAL